MTLFLPKGGYNRISSVYFGLDRLYGRKDYDYER